MRLLTPLRPKSKLSVKARSLRLECSLRGPTHLSRTFRWRNDDECDSIRFGFSAPLLEVVEVYLLRDGRKREGERPICDNQLLVQSLSESSARSIDRIIVLWHSFANRIRYPFGAPICPPLESFWPFVAPDERNYQ